ncbi:MAG: efflux RND transporter periplasmic adaptor subunit [Bradymonadia bacterium]
MYRNKLQAILWVLGLAALSGCGSDKQESSGAMSEQTALTQVEVQTVSTSSFSRERTYVGNITAAKEVKVIPLASERILKYPWENGDYIEKGQVIAEIRNEVNRKGLDAVNAQLRSIEAQLKAAEREKKRVESMYESNVVSRQSLDQATDAVTTLTASKMQLLASQEQTKLGLDYARVIAPIDGVISQKSSEVGDIASSAMPLCVLLDMKTLKVTLNVTEEDMPYLKLGQEVRLRFDAYPGEVTVAKITRIMPYVNTSSRTNTVEAEFPNVKNEQTGQYRFKPGMYSKADLSLDSTNDAIVVPPRALILAPELLEQQASGQKLRRAFVVNADNTVSARTVEAGERQGDTIEILSGLQVGDKLVIRGHHSLIDGDRVNIAQTSSKAATAEKAAPSAAAVPAGTETTAPVVEGT